MNSVYLDEKGIINHIYIGDQSVQTITDDIAKIRGYVGQVRSQNKPVKLFLDLTAIGKTTDAARRVSIDSTKDLKYDRVAVYTRSLFYKYLVKLVASQLFKFSRIEYFDSKERAISWLNEEQN